MVLYTDFNGEVNKKLMVNYTTITCLCFHDNYMPSLNVHFYVVKHIFYYCKNKNNYQIDFFCEKICVFEKNVVILRRFW